MNIIDNNLEILYNKWQREEKKHILYIEQQKLFLFLLMFQITVVYLYYVNLYYNFIILVCKFQNYNIFMKNHILSIKRN